MNNAKPIPIENGNYILVRLQNYARDNDIVIANLNEPDPLGTVKRLGFTGGRITLRPESFDPKFQNDPDFDRTYTMDEVRISGIVEAVFKKKSG
jgi:SOS-response transcriptional repressor LexA